MKFAGLAAAYALLALLISPVRHVVREIVTLEDSSFAGQAAETANYLAVLGAIYALFFGAFWLLGRVLAYRGQWTETGLADLDAGVYQAWPFVWALVAGGLAVLGIVVAGQSQDPHVVGEAFAMTGAVLIAVAWRAAPIRIEDADYDPLPRPVAPPTSVPEPTAATKRLNMGWYFRHDPTRVAESARYYEVQIDASEATYEELLARDHSVSTNACYGRFVRDGLTREVSETASRIRSLSRAAGLGAIAEINNVLAFAQRFAYVSDQEDKGCAEYPKYPLETMWEDRGDCEDHAIAAAACLVLLGYDVRLVSVDYGREVGHMALAVAPSEEPLLGESLGDPTTGRRFYYCEVSTDARSQKRDSVSFRMGEMPENERDAQKELILVS